MKKELESITKEDRQSIKRLFKEAKNKNMELKIISELYLISIKSVVDCLIEEGVSPEEIDKNLSDTAKNKLNKNSDNKIKNKIHSDKEILEKKIKRDKLATDEKEYEKLYNRIKNGCKIATIAKEYSCSSSTQFRRWLEKIYGDDLLELQNSSKEEVKEGVKEKVKEEVKEKVKEEVKEKVKEEVKEKVKEGVKEKVKEEVKEKVKEEVKAEVKAEVKEEVKEGVVVKEESKNKIKSLNAISNMIRDMEKDISVIEYRLQVMKKALQETMKGEY